MELKDSKTAQNLKDAFAGESGKQKILILHKRQI